MEFEELGSVAKTDRRDDVLVAGVNNSVHQTVDSHDSADHSPLPKFVSNETSAPNLNDKNTVHSKHLTLEHSTENATQNSFQRGQDS